MLGLFTKKEIVGEQSRSEGSIITQACVSVIPKHKIY